MSARRDWGGGNRIGISKRSGHPFRRANWEKGREGRTFSGNKEKDLENKPRSPAGRKEGLINLGTTPFKKKRGGDKTNEGGKGSRGSHRTQNQNRYRLYSLGMGGGESGNVKGGRKDCVKVMGQKGMGPSWGGWESLSPETAREVRTATVGPLRAVTVKRGGMVSGEGNNPSSTGTGCLLNFTGGKHEVSQNEKRGLKRDLTKDL